MFYSNSKYVPLNSAENTSVSKSEYKEMFQFFYFPNMYEMVNVVKHPHILKTSIIY